MNYWFVLPFIFVAQFGFTQNAEFPVHPNGLIYNEATMEKLTGIVDSLNLRYKKCELIKPYYSKSQTIGHYIKLNKGNIQAALKDLENQIEFHEFKIKYPDAEVIEDNLIIKNRFVDYDGNEMLGFRTIDLNGGYGYNISKNIKNFPDLEQLKGTWITDYTAKTKFWKESLQAFYFPNDFNSEPLTEKYARMVGYADCLIDTTSGKLFEDAGAANVDLPKNWQRFSQKRQENLLNEMRNTRVIGMCSQDLSPRIHAINIAKLSAETINWEVFLKSHLDIMNDRFDRMSDGSYAWESRKTYIRELEELNIDVPELILGISLRIDNPAKFHYYGSIHRIGRALSESRYSTEVEETILSMIKDSDLDDYNRVICFYLLQNYIHYHEDDNLKKVKSEMLNEAVSFLPGYIKEKIK